MNRHDILGLGWFSAAILIVFWGAIPAAAVPAGPVVASSDGNQIVMDNGIVGLTIDKRRGTVSSIRGTVNGKPVEYGNGGGNALAYDFDAGNPSGSGTRHAVPFSPALTRLLDVSSDSAEAVVGAEPTDICPFHSEMHLILRRGDSGFYMWIQFVHTTKMPGTILEQTRVVIRPTRGTIVFTNYVIDNWRTGPFPTGPILETVFDTTWRYAFDGIAHSKYECVAYIGDDLVHGMAGHGEGIWLIQPGREYVNGGPLRQELTVHQDTPTQPDQNNILLWMLQGNHFGAGRIFIDDKQAWSHFYGPCFVYLNSGGSVDDLWADAKSHAKAEDAKWPYPFVNNEDYPLQRGIVSGQIKLTDGHTARDAWVVLTDPKETDWCMAAGGYEFWTRAGADGRFSIPKVRPGTYNLFVSGADQFEDYLQNNVTVTAGATTDIGTIDWHPITHGKKIWEIGVADHSSGEFKNGNDYRHFDNNIRYIKSFPNDVNFVIGKSKESADFNFSQWGWYVKQPYWSIKFDQETDPAGRATVTLGFCAFDYSWGLAVELNGHRIGVIHYPKTGMAAYRCGRQDSQYHVSYLPFDATYMHAGTNEMRLIPLEAVPYAANNTLGPNTLGAIMYDAIRLEIDPDGKPG